MTNPVKLAKGEDAALITIDPTLRRVMIAAGWNAPQKHEGYDVDIDLSAFLLRSDNLVRKDADFVFYNNPQGDAGNVEHKGSVAAEGSTDREAVEINVEALGYDIESIRFVVSIHNAEERHQHFGIVSNLYLRFLNAETKTELARYELEETLAESNAVVMGQLIRDGLGWKFTAQGEGSNGGLYKIAHDLHVNVAPI